MTKNFLKTLSIIAIIFLTVQCKKEPIPVNENELITRIVVTLVDSSHIGLPQQVFLYCVNDGEFGNRQDTIQLYAATKYGMEIKLYNVKSETEIENITQEIKDEADDHQFFIQSDRISNFNYLDEDDNKFPLGLHSTFQTTTNTTGLGNFRITLLHGHNKNASGVSENDPKNAGGGTDVDATFKLKIVNKPV